MPTRSSGAAPLLTMAFVMALLCLACGGDDGRCEFYVAGGAEACETSATCPPCGPVCEADGFEADSGPECVDGPFGPVCECTCRICYDAS